MSIDSNASINPFSRLLASVSLLSRNLAAVLLVAMVILIGAQVIYRYLLNDSLPWSEEIARYLMVWMTCLVSPWVYRQNMNVAIELFADAFPRWWRQASQLLINVLILLVAALFLIESLAFVKDGMSINAASFELKLGYMYLCMPFLFVMVCCISLEKIVLNCLSWTRGEKDVA